mgnify:CR=1 FL=1
MISLDTMRLLSPTPAQSLCFEGIQIRAFQCRVEQQQKILWLLGGRGLIEVPVTGKN